MLHTPWRRLIRFVALEDGHTHFGEPLDSELDIGQAYDRQLRSEGKKWPIKAYVIDGDVLSVDQDDKATAKVTDEVRTVKELLPPLSAFQVNTIRALGANFAPAKKTTIPILFYKPLTALSGPSQPIYIPKVAQEGGDQSDYEVELVVVIGKRCRDVSPGQALDYVLGYTLANDVSARKLMFAVPQWSLGKSFDGWMPIGPCIVSTSLIGNPGDVALRTTLNGNMLQDGNTKDMLWGVAETISALSRGTTLEPGSIISMGTPPGEGFKRNPQVWLKHDDIVHCSGSHGLGTLINSVVEEDVVRPSAPKAKL